MTKENQGMTISNYCGATGIGVSDLKRSTDFYMNVFGMKKLWKLKLSHMHEMILNFEGERGSSVVLMHYIDGSNPNYKNNPVKLVFYVTDPKACIEKIRREGLEIVRDAEPVPELRNAVVGLAKDPDGYLLEILQAVRPA
jgi:lactoylglutathione lyase